jgi:hypothetical protein
VLEKRLLPHGRRAGAPLGRVAWLRAVAISFAISGVMVGGIAATSGASGATAAPTTSTAADIAPATTTTSTVPASDDVPPPGTAVATTTTTTTTTVPPAPPPAPAPSPPPAAAPAPAPAPPPAPVVPALPARGEATASGCSAALAYLAAYSAPGFTFACPGYALGHEAMTCINEPGACPGENLIAIADPCANAYMNEASNSWVLTGQSSAPIDPYGAC